MSKKIRLTELKALNGKPFRDVVRNESEEPVLEPRKDSDGRPIMQVPRDGNGIPYPNVMPEPLYQHKTITLGKKDALPTLLKTLYLQIPQDRLTRQFVINGTRMFESIDKASDSCLELSDDIYKWVCTLLQDKETEKDGKVIPGIGLSIFRKELTIIEDAMDNIEKLHEPEKKGGIE